MKNRQIQNLSYVAMYIALYVILKFIGNLIPFLQMPNGGSIELELIAVFIASYHLGWKTGGVIAILSWLITWILGFPMWYVHPVQIFLDYVGPLLVCGLASALWWVKNNNNTIQIVMSVLMAAAAFFGIMNSYTSSAALIMIAVLAALAVFAFNYYYLKNDGKYGIVIAMLLKYFLQVLSGVYYWFPEGSYAGSAASWAFSLGYNLWYNLVTMVICVVVVPELIRRLKQANVTFIA